MNKFNLTLDNLIYSLVVLENEDITFVLPKKLPTDSYLEDKNIFKAVVETTLKVFIRTKVSTTPKLNFIGQDEKQKIVMSGSLELLPDSLLAVTMTTVDGGTTWLVNSCNAASETAEGAQETANNAQEIAVKATATAESAVETSNSAKTIASDAQGKAENANLIAATANSTATAANDTAKAAVDAAQQAQINVNTAVETAVDAKQVADTAEEKATNAITTAETAQETANTAQETADMAKAKADTSLQQKHEGFQVIDSGLVLGKTRKFLFTRANGGTPLAFAMNQYNELTDVKTGAGLEQAEFGTPQTIMCLNHCGATFTTASGEQKTVDGHIRVDHKENADAPTIQDQLAYMSDISALKSTIQILVKHIENLENVCFWISDETLKPTRPVVDPDTLEKLPE